MGEAERAFEQLRAEVTVMRRIVEELQQTVEAVPTDDMSATLQTMARTQAGLLRRIERITDYIGAATPPERLQRELTWARDTVLRPVVERLTVVEGDVKATLQTLHVMIGTVRSREQQRRVLRLALAIGVAMGLAGYPLVVQSTVDAVVDLWRAAGVPSKAR